MIIQSARTTLLAALLAASTLAAQAGVSEARYLSFDLETHASVPLSEVQVLGRDGGPEWRVVGILEALGAVDPEVDVLERVNGLRLPGPLPFFDTAAARVDDDAGLALSALKSAAATNGVQAVYIIESGRTEIRRKVVGHRLTAKAYRKVVPARSSAAPR